MYRVQHIAKIWQRLLPSLGGGLGWGLMLILLLAGGRYANAQNTSSQPYIGSTHLYGVPMGDFANTVQWEISNPTYNSGNPIDLTSISWTTPTKIDNTSPTRDSAYIEITFENTIFSLATGTWRLVYSEMNGNSCVARRYVQINPMDNTFYLSLPEDGEDCNSRSGDIWANTIADISAADYVSSISFTVTMNKSATFETDKWRFTGSCVLTAGALFTHLYATTPFASTSGTTTNGGNWTITGTGGNFVLEVSYLPGGNYPGENDTVEFFVNVEGDVTQDFTLQLTVSNGQADSGENYVSVTNDNTTLGGDRVVSQTIRGVPNTPVITMND